MSESTDTYQCYQLTASPSVIDWTATCKKDCSTNTMLFTLSTTAKPEWSTDFLNTIKSEYQSHLKNDFVRMLHDKLVLYKPIFKDIKYIGLIIVPEQILRGFFSHYHAGPSGGHMSEYKILFRLRMRFYWPSMRQDINNWIKGCAHCVAYNVWRNRKSELYFSWPVTSTFYIMHVDLWATVTLLDDSGQVIQMNCMCDLTQFVVSVLVTDTTSEILSKFFMEHVVLSFGMVAVIIVDTDSKFLNLFQAICVSLLVLNFGSLLEVTIKGLVLNITIGSLIKPRLLSALTEEHTYLSLNIIKHHNMYRTVHL